MRYSARFLIIPAILIVLAATGSAAALASPASSGVALWQDLAPGLLPGKAQIATSHRRTLRLDEERLLSLLAGADREDSKEIEIALPSPGGGFTRYRLVEASVMAPELAARSPTDSPLLARPEPHRTSATHGLLDSPLSSPRRFGLAIPPRSSRCAAFGVSAG